MGSGRTNPPLGPGLAGRGDGGAALVAGGRTTPCQQAGLGGDYPEKISLRPLISSGQSPSPLPTTWGGGEGGGGGGGGGKRGQNDMGQACQHSVNVFRYKCLK